MQGYQKEEWRRMVSQAESHFDSACPLIEDEVVVAVDKDMRLMYNFVHYIANDWIESSFDKVMAQRSDYIRRAKQVLEEIHG
jgi:hypothetical protein